MPCSKSLHLLSSSTSSLYSTVSTAPSTKSVWNGHSLMATTTRPAQFPPALIPTLKSSSNGLASSPSPPSWNIFAFSVKTIHSFFHATSPLPLPSILSQSLLSPFSRKTSPTHQIAVPVSTAIYFLCFLHFPICDLCSALQYSASTSYDSNHFVISSTLSSDSEATCHIFQIALLPHR